MPPEGPEPENAGGPRRQRGRFAPGVSGCPGGSKRGSRPAALLRLDKLAERDAGAVLRRVLDRALAGDARAAEIVLARMWPIPRTRRVTVSLPDLRERGAHGEALALLAQEVARGHLAPDEAGAIAALVERHAGLAHLDALEARVAQLEAERQRGTDAAL